MGLVKKTYRKVILHLVLSNLRLSKDKPPKRRFLQYLVRLIWLQKINLIMKCGAIIE